MEANEEYLLRVLHRTYNGLRDSLIPAHGLKLTKLLQVLETVPSLTNEVKKLINVQGFTKCALAMQWLLERTQNSSDDFSLEQFESDILLLNEKLFEAFLNQPFDMPDFGRTEPAETAQRLVQKDIQVSADEFIPSSVSTPVNQPLESPTVEAKETVENTGMTLSTPDWSVRISTPQDFETELISSMSVQAGEKEITPSLADAMDADLYEMVDRISKSIIEFSEKASGERTIAMAVLRVAARSAADAARAASNVLVHDFFTAFLKVISYADEQGKIRSDALAETMRDIGDRLSIALTQPSGGVTLLQNLIKYISEPKELLSK